MNLKLHFQCKCKWKCRDEYKVWWEKSHCGLTFPIFRAATFTSLTKVNQPSLFALYLQWQVTSFKLQLHKYTTDQVSNCVTLLYKYEYKESLTMAATTHLPVNCRNSLLSVYLLLFAGGLLSLAFLEKFLSFCPHIFALCGSLLEANGQLLPWVKANSTTWGDGYSHHGVNGPSGNGPRVIGLCHWKRVLPDKGLSASAGTIRWAVVM